MASQSAASAGKSVSPKWFDLILSMHAPEIERYYPDLLRKELHQRSAEAAELLPEVRKEWERHKQKLRVVVMRRGLDLTVEPDRAVFAELVSRAWMEGFAKITGDQHEDAGTFTLEAAHRELAKPLATPAQRIRATLQPGTKGAPSSRLLSMVEAMEAYIDQPTQFETIKGIRNAVLNGLEDPEVRRELPPDDPRVLSLTTLLTDARGRVHWPLWSGQSGLLKLLHPELQNIVDLHRHFKVKAKRRLR